MHSVKVYSALLAAGASVASAASATCTTDITITQPTPTITCDVVDANINVDPSVAGNLVVDGPKQIKGNFIIANVSQLISFSSTSINSFQGDLILSNLELLNTVKLLSVTTLNSLNMLKLPQLNSLSFNPNGVEKASSIMIADTFLSNLDSFQVKSVDSIEITNNHKLTLLEMPLVHITKLFGLNSNGNGMDVKLNSLETAAEMQFSDIKSLSVPNLAKLNGSIKFDKNAPLTSFSAPKLESVANSVTFINNNALVDMSFPLLESVGDLTIQNNTAMNAIPFPALKTVTGGVILRGSFDNVTLDELSDVKGGVTVTSTTDIGDVCKFFDDAKKHNIIQGSEKCTSNNTKANEGGDGGSTGHGSSGTSEQSAAFSIANNMGLALGLMVLTGIAQLL